MSLKLKISLGILLLIAGFLLVRIGLFFKHSVQTATTANINRQVAGVNIFDPSNIDSDNDGIPDNLEAYYRTDPFNPDTDGDGYLDGEEIVSGFSPIKQEIASERNKNTNITVSFTNHVMEGLYVGDLSPKKLGEEKFAKNIDNLTLATIDDAARSLNPPIVTEYGLAVISESKQNQNEYINNVDSLLEGPFLNSFMQQPYILSRAANFMTTSNNSEAAEIFKNLSLSYSSAYNRLLAVSVPKNWVPFHSRLLQLFQKFSLNYLALTKAPEDPLLAMTALQDLQNNFIEIDSSLIQELKILIQTQDLQIPNTPLFSILDLLSTQKNQ
ncbi:MAG: hypothetical protein HYT61_00090 [Candidatus Yanofskybacteria bacterium]|nr:hypothetical protein [Candidatus Yanofskybacteria bacterium]